MPTRCGGATRRVRAARGPPLAAAAHSNANVPLHPALSPPRTRAPRTPPCSAACRWAALSGTTPTPDRSTACARRCGPRGCAGWREAWAAPWPASAQATPSVSVCAGPTSSGPAACLAVLDGMHVFGWCRRASCCSRMLRCSCSACHPPVNSWPPTAACRPADFSAYRLLRHWLPGKPPDEAAAAAAAGSGGSGGQPPPSGLLAALADAGSAIVCGGLAGMVMWAVRHLSRCRGCWLSPPGVGVLPAGSAGRQQQCMLLGPALNAAATPPLSGLLLPLPAMQAVPPLDAAKTLPLLPATTHPPCCCCCCCCLPAGRAAVGHRQDAHPDRAPGQLLRRRRAAPAAHDAPRGFVLKGVQAGRAGGIWVLLCRRHDVRLPRQLRPMHPEGACAREQACVLVERCASCA